MAEEKPYLTGRTYLFKLPKGKDLLESLADFCHDNQVKCGIVNVIGSVSNATIGCYDQNKKKYDKTVINQEMELISLCGNISIQDNRPQVHAHVVMAGKDNHAIGGHLFSGTQIYVCQAYIPGLVGGTKVKRTAKMTELSLWG